MVVLDNNEEYAAQLIGSDVSTDLAVIKIDAENLTGAELGDSDQLKVGEPVVAIGNPAGLNLAGSTTQGIVSVWTAQFPSHWKAANPSAWRLSKRMPPSTPAIPAVR